MEVRFSSSAQVQGTWGLYVAASAALVVCFSIAHVCEDFVYGVPAQFGFTTASAAALTGTAYAVHVFFIALAARNYAGGYVMNFIAGIFWAAAIVVEHGYDILFASPYRAGFISTFFEIATILSALLLVLTSFLAWRSRR
ncbi:MAG: hypothetical protein AB1553_11335 [Nitrospirota bacterium]